MKPYYADDYVTIYHGDCRDLLPALEADSVDLIFTDPPYGHNNNNGDLAHRWEAALGILPPGAAAPEARPIANDGPEANDLVRWFFAEAKRLLKPGCCCCCGGGGGPDPQFARWSLWLDEAVGFKQAIVWDKGGLGMGWHYRRNYEMVLVAEKPGAACRWYGGNSVANVVRIPGIKPRATDHPTPKPIELPGRFIDWHSQPGDLVLDPFMGGGSTAEAAKKSGRRFIGIEISEQWCEYAAKRCAQEVLDFGAAS
ncbi:MAG TPA: site-specific DNA-methyltransferase [Nocardioidaceae bacterium]|nr:site-specific DNA-methyltransferase [Nocardioidaceae bacterium]